MNGLKKTFKIYLNNNKNKNKNFYDKQKYNKTKQNPLASQNICDQLEYVTTIEDHNQAINNILVLNELNYVTSDSNEFYIRAIGNKEAIYKDTFKNEKINKIIFSSEKLIFSVEYTNESNGINQNEKQVSYALKVATINNGQMKYFSCKTNNKPIDFFESDNAIVIVGNNIIELYRFNQNDNNNNQLTKVSEIKLSNNDNDNNDKNQILCIERANDALICGHASGHISIWKPIKEYPFLKNTSVSRIHAGPINKIIYSKNSENIDIIISCSSDKTVKVHSIEDTICFDVLKLNDEVINLEKLIDLKKQINYIISLKNGILKVYNASFNEVFEIPKRTNINQPRLVININNCKNNEGNNDDYILITEENKVDLYKWKNKENNKSNVQSNKKFHGKYTYGNKWNNKY